MSHQKIPRRAQRKQEARREAAAGNPAEIISRKKKVRGSTRVVASDAVERNLAAHEEDEQRDDGPHHPLLELDVPLRRLHFREDAHDGLDEV